MILFILQNLISFSFVLFFVHSACLRFSAELFLFVIFSTFSFALVQLSFIYRLSSRSLRNHYFTLLLFSKREEKLQRSDELTKTSTSQMQWRSQNLATLWSNLLTLISLSWKSLNESNVRRSILTIKTLTIKISDDQNLWWSSVRMMILKQSKRRKTLFRRRRFDVLIRSI